MNQLYFQGSVVTNRDGVWLPVALPPGDYTLQAGAPDYGAWPAPRRTNLSHTSLTITTTLAPSTNVIAAGDFEGDQVYLHLSCLSLHLREFFFIFNRFDIFAKLARTSRG